MVAFKWNKHNCRNRIELLSLSQKRCKSCLSVFILYDITFNNIAFGNYKLVLCHLASIYYLIVLKLNVENGLSFKHLYYYEYSV